ncbi:hypothetical protein BH10PAT3_BH10PAT3_1960 [soil metagenome]
MPMPNIQFKSLPPIIPGLMNKAELIDNMNDSVRSVAAALAGEIALPQIITIKFGKSKKNLAKAVPGEIQILPDSFEYLEGHTAKGASIFCGIVAHEFSHVSDFFTKNSADKIMTSVVDKVIGEGKADHVASFIGGTSYSDELVRTLSNTERETAYNDLLLSERSTYAVKRWTEKRLRIGSKTPLSMENGIYATGFALIEDTMKWTGAGSIFDVHEKHHNFFMDALRDNIDQEAVVSVLDMTKGNG